MDDVINILRNIKVVGLDFDDTIVDEKHSVRRRWEKTFEEFSFLSDKLNEVFLKIYKQRGPLYKFHVNDTLQELGIDPKYTKEIVNKFLSRTADELVFKGVKDFICFLKRKKLFVGIITDGKQSYQQERIKNTGIHEQMDFIYYGEGKKEQKPLKGVVDEIINRFGVKDSSEILFIGNDYINDIVGMARVGIKTCLVGEDKSIPDMPDLLAVKNFNELLKICKKYE